MITRNLYNKYNYIEFEDGERLLERDNIILGDKVRIGDKIHIIKGGETLTQISYKYYKEPLLWYIIADVNNILNPFEIESGRELIIPDLSSLI